MLWLEKKALRAASSFAKGKISEVEMQLYEMFRATESNDPAD
jgi:hypothetical protein